MKFKVIAACLSLAMVSSLSAFGLNQETQPLNQPQQGSNYQNPSLQQRPGMVPQRPNMNRQYPVREQQMPYPSLDNNQQNLKINNELPEGNYPQQNFNNPPPRGNYPYQADRPTNSNDKLLKPNYPSTDSNGELIESDNNYIDSNQDTNAEGQPIHGKYRPLKPNNKPMRLREQIDANGNSKSPRFNPDENSVRKNVYGQFIKQEKTGQSPNKMNRQQEKSVVRAAYKLESNLFDLKDIKKAIDMPRIDQEKPSIDVILSKMNDFLAARDVQYTKMLEIIKVIESIDDTNTKAKLVEEFQKVLKEQTQIDQQGHGRIEASLKHIQKIFNNLPPEEKEKIQIELKPIIEKFYQHKAIIKFLHEKLRTFKSATVKNALEKLLEKAKSMQANGDKQAAAKYYEEALSMDENNPRLIKDAGKALSEAEGKGPKVYVKGKKPEFDVKPTIINNVTMVPLRPIANALGISNENIRFDPNTQTITLIKNDNEVKLIIGKPSVWINNVEKTIPVPAMIIDKRTLVPARVISEALDANVTYEQETQMITIDDKFGSNTPPAVSSEITDLSKKVQVENPNLTLTEEQIMTDYLDTEKTPDVKDSVDSEDADYIRNNTDTENDLVTENDQETETNPVTENDQETETNPVTENDQETEK